MKANEFDKAIRHSYDQGSFDYNPAQWENLLPQLNEAESKKKSLAWLPFISYAASVLFMVGIGAFLMRNNAPQDGIASTESWPEHSMIFTQPHVKTELAWQNTAHSNALTAAAQSAPARATQPLLQEPVAMVQNTVIAVTLPNDENILSASIADVQAPVQPLVRKAPKYIDFNSYNYEPAEQEKRVNTSICLTGGVNYGGSNSGYAMGITAHQKLGENVFVEGDIAFVNNMSGKKTEYVTEGYVPPSTTITTQGTSGGASTTTGAKGAHTAARPSGTTPLEDANTTTTITIPGQAKGSHYNMFYAQVTPTVGYNVFKNLSLSGGADLQRLLQGEKLMTVTQNVEDAKHLPSYDLGFVGKTEYAVSKQIKATVYYRHGLNNAVSGTDKYIDRNYIQFQLKFSILNR